MLLKDSYGNKSLTATMAVFSFIIVMLKVLFSGAAIQLAGFSYSFGTIDALTVGAILTPVLGSYTARRWGSPVSGNSDEQLQDPGRKAGDGR